MPHKPHLEQRDWSILQSIISSYISTGEPVGSRAISRRLDFGLSPATVRNIMADLEELGYLTHPHVSAGRVPTDKAYRFYVDSLVKGDPDDPTLAALERVYRSLRGEPENLVRETSRALSEVTRYIGLVQTPRFIDGVLSHIEFVKLKRRKVLAILVSEEGMIQNRLLVMDRECSQRELQSMADLLNERYANLPLREVRERIREEMTREKTLYDRLLEEAISMATKSMGQEHATGAVHVEGTANILALPEFADFGKMRALLRAFEEKGRMVDVMDRCIDAEGVKIFIGVENPYQDLQGMSLVAAPYRREGQVLGVIGVLGPTRMDYEHVIPMVDYTARYLTRILTTKY